MDTHNVLSQELLNDALETRKRLMRLIEQLHAMDMASFTQLFGDHVDATDPTASSARTNMSLRPQLTKSIDACQARLADAYMQVEALRKVAELDFRTADVLEARYFFDKSWALIADELGISQPTCYRIRREALSWIEKNQPSESYVCTANQ